MPYTSSDLSRFPIMLLFPILSASGKLGRLEVICLELRPPLEAIHSVRTMAHRFRITRLSGNLYVGGLVRHIARSGCAHGPGDRPPGISAGGRPSGVSRTVLEWGLLTPDRRACGHDALQSSPVIRTGRRLAPGSVPRPRSVHSTRAWSARHGYRPTYSTAARRPRSVGAKASAGLHA
jgi:hypothetical protein